MKKWIIPILAAFVLVSCNLPFTISLNTPIPPTPFPPQGTPEILVVTATNLPTALPTPTPQFSGLEKNLGGVSMTIPTCLASDASGVIIPEENPGGDMPPFAFNPEYRKITLIGYPLTGKFFEPIVQVYPVARFVELVPDVSTTVNGMQQLLNNHPANIQTGIPFLPIENAAQVFRAQVGYLNFQNGQGIGFLTEYAQYSAPVNNHDLFYTFQGLTNDGKYWISMLLPANAAYLQPAYNDNTLPAGGVAAPDMNSANFSNEMTAYYAAMVQKLNGTPADQFTPSLSCIAQFVQSINISD